MMKGIFGFFEKKVHFSSLHVKRKLKDSKNEKYFDFLKMDKNKCPKSGCQNTPY
jgi:hypothetical protein